MHTLDKTKGVVIVVAHDVIQDMGYTKIIK